MDSRQKIILEDALEALIDYRGKTPKKTSEGVPLVTAKIVKDGFINEPNEFIADSDYVAWMSRGLPEIGDVVLTVEAPLGQVAQIKTKHIALAQRTVTLRGKEGVLNNAYLKYYLMSPVGQKSLLERGTGTTVVGIKQSELRKIELNLLSYEAQKKVGDALSAYDNLVENNYQRIRMLESITQKIYIEWFGLGQNVKTNSWRKMALDQCLKIERGKSYSGKDLEAADNSVPFVNLKCIKRNGGFRKDGLKSFSGTYKESHIVRKGDIVMAVTDMTQERMIVARSARVPSLGSDFGVISMDLVKIEPKENCDRDFLYAYLRWSDFADNVKNYANGANVLHLLPDRVAEYEVFLPPLELQKKFSSVVKDMFEQIDVLELACDNLKKTRDLLIPQLVTGKLAIKS